MFIHVQCPISNGFCIKKIWKTFVYVRDDSSIEKEDLDEDIWPKIVEWNKREKIPRENTEHVRRPEYSGKCVSTENSVVGPHKTI